MATNAPLPPSELLSSRVVSLSEAHDFVTEFIAKVDEERRVTNIDLVLADQRRIAQALEGVYVPKPEPTPGNKEEEDGQEDGAVTGEISEVVDTEMGGMDAESTATTGETSGVGGVIDKAKRKAEKKARQLEEKRKRAEALAKEKENQD